MPLFRLTPYSKPFRGIFPACRQHRGCIIEAEYAAYVPRTDCLLPPKGEKKNFVSFIFCYLCICALSAINNATLRQ